MTTVIEPTVTVTILGGGSGGPSGSTSQVGGELPFGSSLISFVSHNGTDTATVTTKFPHNFITGQEVDVVNIDEPLYNGTGILITVTSPTTFIYELIGSPVTPSGGTNAYTIAAEGATDLDALSDEYWESWASADLPYTYVPGVPQWEHTFASSQTNFGLQAISSGPPGNWVAGFRPSDLDITLNSDIDRGGFGFLTGINIRVVDSSNNNICNFNFDFTSYNQDINNVIPLDFSSTTDIDTLRISSFIYNNGPLIRQVIFRA